MKSGLPFRLARKPISYLLGEVIKLREQIEIQQGVIEELCISAVKHGLPIAEEPFIPEYLCLTHFNIEHDDSTRTSAYVYDDDKVNIVMVKLWIDISSGENLEKNNNTWAVKVDGKVFKVEITNMLDAIHVLKTLGADKVTIENYIAGNLCFK